MTKRRQIVTSLLCIPVGVYWLTFGLIDTPQFHALSPIPVTGNSLDNLELDPEEAQWIIRELTWRDIFRGISEDQVHGIMREIETFLLYRSRFLKKDLVEAIAQIAPEIDIKGAEAIFTEIEELVGIVFDLRNNPERLGEYSTLKQPEYWLRLGLHPWTQEWNATPIITPSGDVKYNLFLRFFEEESKNDHPNRKIRVLDIGTGTMEIPYIASRVSADRFELHGVDIADVRPEKIDKSRGRKGIQFHRVLSESTDFPSDYFDVVTSAWSWEFSDQERTLLELNRIMMLNGKGMFLIHYPNSTLIESAKADIGLQRLLTSEQFFQVAESYLENPSNENRDRLIAVLRALSTSRFISHDFIDFGDFLLNRGASNEEKLRVLKNAQTALQRSVDNSTIAVKHAVMSQKQLEKIMRKYGFQITKIYPLHQGNAIVGRVVEFVLKEKKKHDPIILLEKINRGENRTDVLVPDHGSIVKSL